jgi:hypothetical protein
MKVGNGETLVREEKCEIIIVCIGYYLLVGFEFGVLVKENFHESCDFSKDITRRHIRN